MNWNISIAYPWWYIAICLLCGLLYAGILYYKNAKDNIEFPFKWVKWALPFLRFSLASILAFLLLAPLLKYTGFETEKPIVLVAADNTASLAENKNPITASAYQEMIGAIQEKLGEKYKVELAQVNSTTGYCEKEVLDLEGKESNLSSALRFAKEQYVNFNLAGMVLLTDGIYNAGSNPDFALEENRFPIYTLGLGDTNTYADFKISQMATNSVAYLGNDFPVQVDVRALQLQGKQGKLSLLINGSVVDAKNINIDANSFFYEHEFKVKALKVGQTKVEARLTVFENETNTVNNVYSSYVEVIDGKKKIEIWSNGMHPDIGMLRSSIGSSDNYECSIQSNKHQVNPSSDLVVLHNWFENKNQLLLFEKLKSSGIPTCVVLGNKLNHTIFNQWSLPIKFNPISSGINASLPKHNSGFDYFQLKEDAVKSIESWPPLQVPFGKFTGVKNKDIVLYQKIGNVATSEALVSMGLEGNYRYGLIAGTGMWQWRLVDFEKNGSHEYSSDFVSKMTQYLSVKDEQKRLKVYPARREFSLGEDVLLQGELYNQSLDPVANQEIKVSVVNQRGKVFKYTMNSVNTGYRLSVKNLNEGSYRFTANAKIGGEALVDKGFFVVTGTQKELNSLTSNFDLLQDMSAKSNGDFYYSNEVNQLTSDLLAKDFKSVISERETSKSLIHFKWLFWVLLSLLAVEWFMRKWSGGY